MRESTAGQSVNCPSSVIRFPILVAMCVVLQMIAALTMRDGASANQIVVRPRYACRMGKPRDAKSDEITFSRASKFLPSRSVVGASTLQIEPACLARNPVAYQTLAERCEAPNMLTNSRIAVLVSALCAFVLAEPASLICRAVHRSTRKPEQDCPVCH